MVAVYNYRHGIVSISLCRHGVCISIHRHDRMVNVYLYVDMVAVDMWHCEHIDRHGGCIYLYRHGGIVSISINIPDPIVYYIMSIYLYIDMMTVYYITSKLKILFMCKNKSHKN